MRLRLADELNTLVTDDLFAGVCPTRDQPALGPWRLALVSLSQLAEASSTDHVEAAHAHGDGLRALGSPIACG